MPNPPFQHDDHLFRPAAPVRLEANLAQQEIEPARAWYEEHPAAFWEHAAQELEWYAPWQQVYDTTAPATWFPGARCNIVHNCLDRHVYSANRNKLALLWENESGETQKWTYFELAREVNRLAAGLRRLGFQSGSVFVLCLPSIPETVAASLAIAKIGGIQSHIFVGFSAKILRSRIADLQADCVLCADGFSRNGHTVALKDLVDDALAHPDCDSVEINIVVPSLGLQPSLRADRDLLYGDVLYGHGGPEPTQNLPGDHILFVQYTSGTTGDPKGVVHTHGGYMVALHRTMQWVLDSKATDILWCQADLGWITGQSYALWGPLLAGSTTFLYDGHPLYPKADRLWRIIETRGISVLYTTPTLMRMVKRYGRRFPAEHNLETLRLLASVGEPLAPEIWLWWHEHIGGNHCPLLNTWWQTETGTIVISSLPANTLKPGSVGRPLPGMKADVVDAQGHCLPANESGHLVLSGNWPSFFKGLFRENATRYPAYWSTEAQLYWTGDLARQDEDGYLWILGRADDVLNTAGHILGAAEFENALLRHPHVHEAAVVPIADKIRGQAAKAFVVVKEQALDNEKLSTELTTLVRQELGPVAFVKDIAFVDALPKTDSGKILRRALRDLDEAEHRTSP